MIGTDVAFIDDVVTEEHDDGIRLKEIVGQLHYSICFINKKRELDKFLGDTQAMKKTRLVLLDLDLSEIGVDGVTVLERLTDKGLRVIILSALPKIENKIAHVGELYKKGAFDFLSKQDLRDEKASLTTTNKINQLIKDPFNTEKILWVDYASATIEIHDNNNLVYKKTLTSFANWDTRREYKTPEDTLLRMFFEMGVTGKKTIQIQHFYADWRHLKKNDKNILKKLLEKLLVRIEADTHTLTSPDTKEIDNIKNVIRLTMRKLKQNDQIVTGLDVDDVMVSLAKLRKIESVRAAGGKKDILGIIDELEGEEFEYSNAFPEKSV